MRLILNPFPDFQASRDSIKLSVMIYVRFLVSLRNVEDLLQDRRVDVRYESIRLWLKRFGLVFAK
ncbi:hypothetical protein GCM10009069_05470 [Algimonas arctica]|uniref:Transposase n=1 Tax=Algimonas arctica TaxID=1479486 RepID=A0A8J3CQ22_9PROT|nr:hypothetical protein GCM10009069_05470 [Algimonas arctica]